MAALVFRSTLVKCYAKILAQYFIVNRRRLDGVVGEIFFYNILFLILGLPAVFRFCGSCFSLKKPGSVLEV